MDYILLLEPGMDRAILSVEYILGEDEEAKDATYSLLEAIAFAFEVFKERSFVPDSINDTYLEAPGKTDAPAPMNLVGSKDLVGSKRVPSDAGISIFCCSVIFIYPT
ncbi:UNVERIFIED_CONTAM: hypothetical protein Sradi_0469800 [Sesamum radiatum]|uniref:Uncharacterized protein n=1 Tax=Sesamum radiatum TaxID=300843 RepID=A0AAW2W723_SESRA